MAEVVNPNDLAALLDEDSISYHTKHVDTIFERVFGES